MTALALTTALPPQELRAESQILGACLAYGVGARARELLRDPEVFYDRAHALIWAACCRLLDSGGQVDAVLVAAELNRLGQLEDAGGHSLLSELLIGCVTPANLEHHCALVLRAARLRTLIQVGADLQAQAYRAEHSPEELVALTQDGMQRVALGHLGGGARRAYDVMEEVLADLDERKLHPGLSGISTGISELDGLTSGWQRGDLVVIAARPSVGKSGLAFGACLASARAGVPTLVYSLEMPARQVGHRLISRESRVNLHRLRHAQLTDEQWDDTARGAARVATLPLWIDDTPGLRVDDIQGRTRRLCLREKIGLVAVDYLQLVEGVDPKDNQEREVARISKGLKAMAKELDVPVLALSQLSRAPEARGDHRPVLSDLRYSGSIEQDADLVIFLYRPELYGAEGDAEVCIAKQRNGPVGIVKVAFESSTASFYSLERKEIR